MTSAEERALKPCPFCGSEVAIVNSGWGAVSGSTARCSNCNASTDDYESEEEAVAAWNRRAES